MNTQYGCKVVSGEGLQKHFSDEVISKLNTIGIKKLLILKRRKKGLTSSGEEILCHNNVETLVATLGGKHKHGYLLEGNTDDELSIDENGKITEFSLVYHSAWLTPEQKLVCVTPREVPTSKTVDLTEDDIYFFLFDGEQKACIQYRDLIFVGRSIEREGQFHLLSKNVFEVEFEPEPYTKHYTQCMYETNSFLESNLTREAFEEVARKFLVSKPSFMKNFIKKSVLTNRTLEQIVTKTTMDTLEEHKLNPTMENIRNLESLLVMDYINNVPTSKKKQKKKINKLRESLTYKFA